MTETMTSNELKRIMPLLARHEGVWDGVYRHFDAESQKVDEHRSRLLCRFPDEGPPYHQTNYYKWDDGRTETRDFPAAVKDGRLHWNNDLIQGWAADVPLDDFKRTTMLHWVRTGEPDLYLYEMIQLSDDTLARARVWHWFKADRLVRRTLVDEHRVSTDWRAYEGKAF
jgi:hypothetical protein